MLLRSFQRPFLKNYSIIIEKMEKKILNFCFNFSFHLSNFVCFFPHFFSCFDSLFFIFFDNYLKLVSEQFQQPKPFSKLFTKIVFENSKKNNIIFETKTVFKNLPLPSQTRKHTHTHTHTQNFGRKFLGK